MCVGADCNITTGRWVLYQRFKKCVIIYNILFLPLIWNMLKVV